MIYSEKYDIYLDSDFVPFRISRNNSYGHRKGQLYRMPFFYDRGGYIRVSWLDGGKTRFVPLHRIIAELLVPNPNNYPTVDHIDGNKLNCNPSNLRFCDTYTQNNNHPNVKRSLQTYGFKASDNPNLYKRLYRERNPDYVERQRESSRSSANAHASTGKRVRFSDGSRHWIPLEDAIALSKIPVRDRVWDEH